MIRQIPFGRTEHNSTRTLFGAAALSQVTQFDADKTLDVLLQYGVNHIDTAASYGDAELRIGPWMSEHRKGFFLATKTGERTYDKARDQIHRSLERLRTDHVDLIQLHYLVKPEEWQIAMGPGGALEACIEAREQGLVRFIGVTGHDITVAAMHKRALEQFDFDSVLLPYNYTMSKSAPYMADFESLMQLCQQRNVAVQTIKSISRGAWHEHQNHHASTWYEPFTDQEAIDTAVHFVLGRPGIFLNTVGDIKLLPKVLDAASRYQAPPSTEAMEASTAQTGATPLFV